MFFIKKFTTKRIGGNLARVSAGVYIGDIKCSRGSLSFNNSVK